MWNNLSFMGTVIEALNYPWATELMYISRLVDERFLKTLLDMMSIKASIFDTADTHDHSKWFVSQLMKNNEVFSADAVEVGVWILERDWKFWLERRGCWMLNDYEKFDYCRSCWLHGQHFDQSDDFHTFHMYNALITISKHKTSACDLVNHMIIRLSYWV